MIQTIDLDGQCLKWLSFKKNNNRYRLQPLPAMKHEKESLFGFVDQLEA